MEQAKTQVIIVNKNPSDASLQIVIPPFRPISMYELEDNFDDVMQEIKTKIYDDKVSSRIVAFMTAFREAMMSADVIPIVEYFLAGDEMTHNPEQIQELLATIQGYIEEAYDENRLMH